MVICIFRKATIAALAVLVAAATSYAAPIVTTFQSDLVRTQTTGAGTYHVVDFFFTMSPGAEFLNYRLAMTAVSGSILDPAKAQRDREIDCTSCNGNTGGAVDTWMNTVASYAGKENDGNSASYVFDAYNPGTQSPPQPVIDWSVFDTVTGDGNTFSNSVPTVFTAPYHLARVLTTFGASGTYSVRVFDTSTLQGQTFTGFWFENDGPEPATSTLLGIGMLGMLGFIRRR